MTYDGKTRIYDLYREAYAIEKSSQSGRILELHRQGKGCQVYLGVTEPSRTKHLFVLYNPGSEPATYDQKAREEAIEKSAGEHADNYMSMADYVQRDERLARNIGKFIRAFSGSAGATYDEIVNDFGQVNTSFYPSRGVQDNDLSTIDYYIETEESFEVLKKELDLEHLRSILFSGPSLDYFFRKIYRSGAQVTLKQHVREIKEALVTKIFNGKEVLCIFIKHLSYVNDPRRLAEGFCELLKA